MLGHNQYLSWYCSDTPGTTCGKENVNPDKTWFFHSNADNVFFAAVRQMMPKQQQARKKLENLGMSFQSKLDTALIEF